LNGGQTDGTVKKGEGEGDGARCVYLFMSEQKKKEWNAFCIRRNRKRM